MCTPSSALCQSACADLVVGLVVPVVEQVVGVRAEVAGPAGRRPTSGVGAPVDLLAARLLEEVLGRGGEVRRRARARSSPSQGVGPVEVVGVDGGERVAGLVEGAGEDHDSLVRVCSCAPPQRARSERTQEVSPRRYASWARTDSSAAPHSTGSTSA